MDKLKFYIFDNFYKYLRFILLFKIFILDSLYYYKNSIFNKKKFQLFKIKIINFYLIILKILKSI